MPDIRYITADSKIHRYYPDFFIQGDNLIVEVKSEYTYNKDFEINLLKKKACLDSGFLFVFYIIGKGECYA